MNVVDSRIGLGMAVACTLFVFASGVTSLKSTPIGWDEVNTAFHLFSNSLDKERTVFETVAGVAKGSPEHGPLYFALLNVWEKVAGSDLFVLRLASVFCGALGVAVCYRLASITGDHATARIAVILVSFLALYLYFQLEIRPYALLATLSGWVVCSYWQALSCCSKTPKWRYLFLFLAAALLLYVHYFGVFVLAAIGIYHLLLARKRANWWPITLAFAAAVLTFTAWLPVALPALIDPRHDLSGERLSFFGSLRAIAAVFSNGLLWPLLAAGAFALINRKRLGQFEAFVLAFTFNAVLLIVVVNEFVPIVVDYRLRYLHELTIPIACSTAIAFRFVIGWRVLRYPMIIVWIAACFAYTESATFGIYSGRTVQDSDKPAHLQKFVYESERVPGHNGLIMAYYPGSFAVAKRLRYYRSVLSDWDYVVNVWQNDAGEFEILSNRSSYNTLEEIAANNYALWMIHNPQRTDFESTDLYQNWLTRHFRPCFRYIEEAESVIEVYVKPSVPCELLTDPEPFSVHYENGTRLANIRYRISSNRLVIYLWWRNTIDGVYSLSLQAFDGQSNKIDQLDAVITDDPINVYSFDVSGLSAGEYVLNLIVYDFVSKESQPGETAEGRQQFERALEIVRFDIGE